MKKYLGLHIIIGLIGMSFLTGCSTDDIDKWSEKGFVWFTNENVDFSFLLHKDVAEGETYLVPVPFTTATTLSDKDRVVNVEVDRQPIDSRTKFELQKPVIFRAGHIVDTMYVKVTNSSHLSQVHDTISFKVLPSEDFNVGLKEGATTNLCLFNGFLRPDWWDEYDAEYYIGYFTQLKMEIYTIVTGGMEDITRGDGWWGNIHVDYTIFLLNEYVQQNDIRYPDDDPNAPGQQPQFDFWTY